MPISLQLSGMQALGPSHGLHGLLGLNNLNKNPAAIDQGCTSTGLR